MAMRDGRTARRRAHQIEDTENYLDSFWKNMRSRHGDSLFLDDLTGLVEHANVTVAVLNVDADDRRGLGSTSRWSW